MSKWFNQLPKSHKDLKQDREIFVESNPTLLVATTVTDKIPYPDDPGHSFTQWLNTGIRMGYVTLFCKDGIYLRATRTSVITPDYYLNHYLHWDNTEKRIPYPRVKGFWVHENREVRLK